MRRTFAKLLYLFRRRRAEADLTREITSHLTLLEDDFQRRGLSAEEAKQAARRAYGSVEVAKDLHREQRMFVWLEHLWQDLRHAARGLVKSPRFVAVAVLSLAFGIGVNTAIFTLVNGILLKKLPVADPDRIVQVDIANYPIFREARQQKAIFADAIGFWSSEAGLESDSESRKIPLDVVSGNYFSFFGARPALGRLLNEEDDAAEGAHRVGVLSYQLWQTHFGGDHGVLQRAIRLNGMRIHVVGVARPDFVGPDLQRRYGVWVPTTLYRDFAGSSRESIHAHWLRTLVRLSPGITFDEAQSRLAAASDVMRSAAGALLRPDRPFEMREAGRGYDTWRSTLHDPLLILMCAAGLVLLVACTNLTNLLLARINERQQEFAVKLSLGISRSRLLRQLLIETLILTLGGGLAGAGVCMVLTQALLVLFNSGNRHRTLATEPDLLVFLFGTGVCVFVALIAGLYPAYHASRTGFGLALKGVSTANAQRGFVRRTLIVVQVGLSVVLLFGASLFAHSLRNLRAVHPGYDIDFVLSMEIAERGSRVETKTFMESSDAADLLARVGVLPGVESAAYSGFGVLSGAYSVGILSSPDSKRNDAPSDAHYLPVGPGYFSTLGIPFLKGRDFQTSDRPGSPSVAIVEQRLASQVWPGEDPIGKQLILWGNMRVQVVGLVADTRYVNIREEKVHIVYPALTQRPTDFVTLQIRFRGEPNNVARQVEGIVRSDMPDYRIAHSATVEYLRDGLISQERLLAFLSSLFGTLGTALSLVGIYGLISYSVARRTREVGIRMSVGAQRGQVLWLFLREAVVLLAVGVALGLPLALGLARLLESLLYDVSTSDPVDISVAVAVLLFGGLLASYLPGRRATRVNPVEALRNE